MDFCGRRIMILVVYWVIMETQLVPSKSHNYPFQHQLHYPNGYSTGCDRGGVEISLKPDHMRGRRDTQAQDGQSRQDEGPMPMLHWMRQVIFKIKSMYTKHRLEFELSGCFFGFIRKILSLIYNSLYSFNKKLMYAKNIKMEDIRGLGKTRNLNSTTSDLIPVGVENISVETQINDALFNNKDKTGDIIEFNTMDGVTKVNENNDESIIAETEKFFTIHEQLERNLDRMNTIHENITKIFDKLKDTIYKISKQKVRNDNLNSKLFNDIVTNKNKDNNTIIRINDKMGGFSSLVLDPIEVIANKTNLIDSLHNKREDEKSYHETINSFENNTNILKLILPSKKISNREVMIKNKIPKSLINTFNDKNTERFENYKKYIIYTPGQIKIISNRVKTLLNHLSSKVDQTEIYKVTSRQFSQESILDSMNAMILHFLGFAPEEDSLAYWMSMVGKETSEHLLRIGSGFHAMRQSQLFSCMAHYGTTKFWNWIDTCC